MSGMQYAVAELGTGGEYGGLKQKLPSRSIGTRILYDDYDYRS